MGVDKDKFMFIHQYEISKWTRKQRFNYAKDELLQRGHVQLFRDCYEVSYLEETVIVNGQTAEMIGIEVNTGVHTFLFPINNNMESVLKYLIELEAYF